MQASIHERRASLRQPAWAAPRLGPAWRNTGSMLLHACCAASMRSKKESIQGQASMHSQQAGWGGIDDGGRRPRGAARGVGRTRLEGPGLAANQVVGDVRLNDVKDVLRGGTGQYVH